MEGYTEITQACPECGASKTIELKEQRINNPANVFLCIENGLTSTIPASAMTTCSACNKRYWYEIHMVPSVLVGKVTYLKDWNGE